MKKAARILWNIILMAAAGVPARSAEATQQPPVGLLNPNTATAEQLGAVPHLDATTVQEIMAARPFTSITGLTAVLKKRALTPEQVAEAYGKVFVPIDLNRATDDEILSIPGVGRRMLHEFKEYRPYESILRFRREIGKYVDDKEVARLERYVVVVPAK